MNLGLAGRRYLVTGGSRGIGQAVVRMLLDEGALVATCGRDEGSLGRLRDELAAVQAGRLVVRAADVRDAAVMKEFAAVAIEAFGGLDGVVANAGAGTVGGVLDTPAHEWGAQVDIKVGGTLNTVLPAVQALASSDAGRVVVMNGVTAHSPDAAMAAVSAARAAVANLTRSLAVELGPLGVCVNAVNLGPILTERQHARFARYTGSGGQRTFTEWCADEAVRRGVLLGRFGMPEEVAPVVGLLLSPLSSFVTGTSIDVSGGSSGRT